MLETLTRVKTDLKVSLTGMIGAVDAEQFNDYLVNFGSAASACYSCFEAVKLDFDDSPFELLEYSLRDYKSVVLKEGCMRTLTPAAESTLHRLEIDIQRYTAEILEIVDKELSK